METAERQQQTPPAPPPAPVRAWRPVALARMLLVVAAAAAVLAGAPTALTGPLSLLAVAAVAERLVRLRDRGGMDGLLVGVGGSVVTLILVGLLLGVSRLGLRPSTWALSLAALALAGLVLAEWLAPASTRRRPEGLRIRSGVDVGWALAISVVLIGALAISVRATDRADVAPVQLAFGPISGSSVQVVVSSDRPTGQLDLQTQAADGTSLTYPIFTVRPGFPVTTSLVIPKSGRTVITLNSPSPDQTVPLRTLIVDR